MDRKAEINNRYKNILEACINSPRDMIILAIDKKYNYLAFNTFHKEVMLKSYGKEVSIGMNINECITNKDDILKLKFNYGKALTGESHTTVEEFGDLDRQYYETRYNPIYNENKEIIGATAFSANVTLSKQMESALKESENRYRELIELAPDGILIGTIDGIISGANNNILKLSGRVLEELIGFNISVLFSDDELNKVPFRYDLLLQGKAVTNVRNLLGIDGTVVCVEMHTKMMPDGTYQSIIHDISDRKLAEEEIITLNTELEERVTERTILLEAANKELEAFAYSVSHDLRAPLRAIDGFSKFILEDYGDRFDSEGIRILGLIRANTQKMDRLITNILALSRVSRSEHTVSKIDMSGMVMSMYNECVSQEARKKLSFVLDPMPEAFGDSTYLKQVWTNLISNAIKFSAQKSKPAIKVGGYTENGYNIYHIKDNGAGFNQEYAHKLFGVFQRLHGADKFEGTGVGLAIVQRIILRHGGKVWAEGSEGVGATFYFSLPIK